MAITFLGLDKEHWDFINSFSNWIAAFGTVGAVGVSLWLALRSERVKLKVWAMNVVVTGTPELSRYVAISATNIGRRAARVVSIGWAYRDTPDGKRQHLYQTTARGDGMSSLIPVTLADSEQASWYVPLSLWLDNLPKLEPKDWRHMVDTFRLQVFTSIGQTFEVPIGDDLKKRMREVFEAEAAKPKPEDGS
ncbi:hypothetical protein [Paraburkholderia atlantica]|uniref:hypothetical protein n=1 Tax=Paraburkholderia atlantica TaxID=2654982 RepID=UPI003D21F76A